MNILVNRKWFSDRSTQSEVLVDGVHECFGLEPRVAVAPIKPRAIPAGTYKVTVRYSPKHKKNVPHVENVPDFEEIEIHIGNFPMNTEGCLLVGTTRGSDVVSNSAAAFIPLFTKISNALHAGDPVTITYQDCLPISTPSKIPEPGE